MVFTIPPLASVGLQEEEARKQGLRFRINKASTIAWYSSRRVGENYSGFKLLIEEDTDRILGAHLLGPHTEEVINIFAIAIRLGFKAEISNMPSFLFQQTHLKSAICYSQSLGETSNFTH